MASWMLTLRSFLFASREIDLHDDVDRFAKRENVIGSTIAETMEISVPASMVVMIDESELIQANRMFFVSFILVVSSWQ